MEQITIDQIILDQAGWHLMEDQVEGQACLLEELSLYFNPIPAVAVKYHVQKAKDAQNCWCFLK